MFILFLASILQDEYKFTKWKYLQSFYFILLGDFSDYKETLLTNAIARQDSMI